MTAMGKPRGEVEHVYLLFVPGTVLGGAVALRRFYPRPRRWLTHLALPLLALQSMLVETFYYTLW